MRWFDLDQWNEIWDTIARNRKRSIMTALGVFWGVCLFVVMTGAGRALQHSVSSNLGNTSVNTSFFFTDVTSIPYRGMPARRWWELDNDDMEAVRKKVPGVKYVAAVSWGNSRKCSYDDRESDCALMGQTPDYQRIAPQGVLFGRFLNEIDEQERRKVCVIGKRVWSNLFPGGENPVGRQVWMDGLSFTVVGVLRKDMEIYLFGDVEESVVIPNSLLQQLFGRGNRIGVLAVTGEPGKEIEKLEEECRQVIYANHMIAPADTNAIWSFNLEDQVKRVRMLLWGLKLLTWIVGMGTLLAGIVGVSNIMLVTVRERTQEIGIRRALGASPRTIVMQMLSESFVLTFLAGIVGLTAGVALLSFAETAFASSPDSNFSCQITFGQGITAACVVVIGSLLAGIIPMLRALKIKAVDAIREE